MLWNSHIHMIATDGARRFQPMSLKPTDPFLKVCKHHVFRMLIEKRRIKLDTG
jgi:hypothetical protein